MASTAMTFGSRWGIQTLHQIQSWGLRFSRDGGLRNRNCVHDPRRSTHARSFPVWSILETLQQVLWRPMTGIQQPIKFLRLASANRRVVRLR